MKYSKLSKILLSAAFALGTVSVGMTTAEALTTTPTVSDYCVTYGHGPSAAGNVVEFNWDHSDCPANSYPHDVTAATTTDNDSGLLPSTFYSYTSIGIPQTQWTIYEGNGSTNDRYTCSFGPMGTTPLPNGEFSPVISCVKD